MSSQTEIKVNAETFKLWVNLIEQGRIRGAQMHFAGYPSTTAPQSLAMLIAGQRFLLTQSLGDTPGYKPLRLPLRVLQEIFKSNYDWSLSEDGHQLFFQGALMAYEVNPKLRMPIRAIQRKRVTATYTYK